MYFTLYCVMETAAFQSLVLFIPPSSPIATDPTRQLDARLPHYNSTFTIVVYLLHPQCRLDYLLCLLAGRLVDFQIRHQERSKSLLINDLCAPRSGVPHPDNNSNFDPKVKWNQFHDESHEILDDREKGEDDPVGQPLRIVLTARVHRFKGHVSGVDETEQVNHKLGSTHKG
jgi:hypothetical protein